MRVTEHGLNIEINEISDCLTQDDLREVIDMLEGLYRQRQLQPEDDFGPPINAPPTRTRVMVYCKHCGRTVDARFDERPTNPEKFSYLRCPECDVCVGYLWRHWPLPRGIVAMMHATGEVMLEGETEW